MTTQQNNLSQGLKGEYYRDFIKEMQDSIDAPPYPSLPESFGMYTQMGVHLECSNNYNAGRRLSELMVDELAQRNKTKNFEENGLSHVEMESVIDSIMPTLKASNISPILIKENIEDSNTLFNGLHDLQAGKTSFFDELNRKKAEGLKLARMEIRNNHPFDVPNFAENCAYKYIEALTFVRNMGNIDTRPIGKICGAMLSTMKTMFGELVELEHADELEGKKGSAVYTESLRRVKKDILEGVARDNGFDPALAREAQLGG